MHRHRRGLRRIPAGEHRAAGGEAVVEQLARQLHVQFVHTLQGVDGAQRQRVEEADLGLELGLEGRIPGRGHLWKLIHVHLATIRSC